MPSSSGGTPSEMSARAEKFSRKLNGRFNLPVYTHDERLTTFEAKGERASRGGQNGSYRDNPVDAIAAALLLQSWLEANTALFNS
jgi:putative Holliday junction resolvase